MSNRLDDQGFPAVVLAGAAKAGTTALAAALGAHPEFCVGTIKEPRFFAELQPDAVGPLAHRFNGSLITDETAYRANFEDASARAVDASTDYLNNPGSAARIAHANPNCRVIIGLRHPVARVWSEHLHLVRNGAETLDLDSALDEETTRRSAGWVPLFGHIERSTYAPGLAAFLEAFGKDQVFIYRHEELTSSPRSVLDSLLAFLGGSGPSLEIPAARNISGVPRSSRLNDVIRSDRPALVKVRRGLTRVTSPQARVAVRSKLDRANLDRSGQPSASATDRILAAVASDVTSVETLSGLDLTTYRTWPLDG